MRLWKVVPRTVRGRKRVGVEHEGSTGAPGGMGLEGKKKGVFGAGALRGEDIVAEVQCRSRQRRGYQE